LWYMRRKGVTKKVRVLEKDVEEPLWRSPRVRRYFAIALAVVVLLIAGGYVIKNFLTPEARPSTGGVPSVMPRDDTAAGRISILEKTGDDYASKAQWNMSASAYLNALELLGYNVSKSDVPRIFGKYCQSRKSLGLLQGGTCKLTNPRDGRTLVKQVN
jgi:hypothetical protein